MKVAAVKKEEASEMFKSGKIDQAIKLFDECIQLDPLHLTFNATMLLNKAIALVKEKKLEEALQSLNLSLKMNPAYAKALVKRGEVKSALGDHDEAVRDFADAKAISDEFGVEGKLK
jgi:tetratricopeptide (TPR) repeat protein